MKRETQALASLILLLVIVFDPLHLLPGMVRFFFILFSPLAVPYFYVMWRGEKSREIIKEDPSRRLRSTGKYGEGVVPAADLPIFGGPMLSGYHHEVLLQRVYLHPDVLRLREHLERKRIEAEKKKGDEASS